MRYLTASLASLVVLATGCCRDAKRTAAKPPIEVIGRTPVSYAITVPQLASKAKARKIAGKVAKPVSAIRDGLPDVQRVSKQPILAVVEQGDWFFYATSIATDQETHQPRIFIAGYAIQKGGREIIEWSVW